VQEVVSASKEGGASLNILSGLVAGNFSVFWKALTLAVLLFLAFKFSGPINAYLNPTCPYGAVFAFGLVAFGLLGWDR
jgi:K(+)-stimulated pyrophosphate-energized sodium pump